MKLVAYGCSFTQGDETSYRELYHDWISDEQIEEIVKNNDYSFPHVPHEDIPSYIKGEFILPHGGIDWGKKTEIEYSHAWPAHLGKIMGLEVLNRGASGASNHEILFRLLVDLESGVVAEDDLIFIASSGWTRHEIMTEDQGIYEGFNKINSLFKDANWSSKRELGDSYTHIMDKWLTMPRCLMQTYFHFQHITQLLDRLPNAYWLETIVETPDVLRNEIKEEYASDTIFSFYAHLIEKIDHPKRLSGNSFHRAIPEFYCYQEELGRWGPNWKWMHGRKHPKAHTHKVYAEHIHRLIKDKI